MPSEIEISKAKEVPITEYLRVRAGIFPVGNPSGKWIRYHSPLRDGDSDPSFFVNRNKNTYVDFGADYHGDSIDLVRKLEGVGFNDAIKILTNLSPSFIYIPNHDRRSQINILAVGDVKDESLLNYCRSRGIKDEISKTFLRQAEISFVKNPMKHYFVLAMKNDKGGYELRNKWIKISSSPKDILTIRGEVGKWILAEGMFDFLSIVQYYGPGNITEGVIVLNTTTFIPKIVPLIEGAKIIYSFLDNDPWHEGKPPNVEERMDFLMKFGNVVDMRYLYRDYIDFNDFIRGIKYKGNG